MSKNKLTPGIGDMGDIGAIEDIEDLEQAILETTNEFIKAKETEEKARDELSVFERANLAARYYVWDKAESDRLTAHLKTYHE